MGRVEGFWYHNATGIGADSKEEYPEIKEGSLSYWCRIELSENEEEFMVFQMHDGRMFTDDFSFYFSDTKESDDAIFWHLGALEDEYGSRITRILKIVSKGEWYYREKARAFQKAVKWVREHEHLRS